MTNTLTDKELERLAARCTRAYCHCYGFETPGKCPRPAGEPYRCRSEETEAFPALVAAVQEARVRELESALRDFKFWLIHKREERVVSVPVEENGKIINRFSAVQIPEWDVRQKIDNVDAALEGKP